MNNLFKSTLITSALLLGSLQSVSGAAANPFESVVYDTITAYPFDSGGLGCCSRTGQTVTLEGSARSVTQFDIFLGSGGPSTYVVEFYRTDGPNSQPGTLIWQSPIQSYPYTPFFYNRKVLSIDVPNVRVPDTFAWALTTVMRDNNILLNTGSPTIGEAGTAWEYYAPFGGWYSPGASLFGARITAVPEPGTAAIGFSGALILGTLIGLRKHIAHRRPCRRN